MNQVFSKQNLLFLFVLLIAITMRFYNFSGWSLSNDELSALSRLQFDGLKNVVKFGVLPDTHPAGTQIFLYYWTMIFGSSETSVRLPFVIAGILSVVFIYLIASKWFNKTTGLFVAISLSFLQYPILYSQLARPYSFGMLFSLASVWFWTLFFFNESSRKLWIYIGFVLSVTFALYTHYFSSLFVFIVGFTGLFFLKKETRKPYWLSVTAIILLYIPHIKIFYYQYKFGFENVSWLGKPGHDWFFKYIQYCFNDSVFLLIGFIIIFILSAALGYKTLKLSKFQFISILWFLIPFIIGYFYSVYKTPILQYSVLIFSFPFLLIFIFSFIPKEPKPYIYVVLMLLTISGISSTVFEKKFYSTQHFGEFKGLAEHIAIWDKKYGNENITRTINLNSPYYIHYYLNKSGDSSKFVKYKFSEENDLGDLIEIVNQSRTPYFIYASSNVFNPLEIKEIIREKFPVIVEEKNYNGSEVTIFKRDSLYLRKYIYQTNNDFEKQYSMWENDSTMIDTVTFLSGKKSCRLDDKKIYSIGFVSNYINFPSKDSCIICISVNTFLTENATAEIVFSVEKPGRENEWFGSKINNMVREKQKWGRAYLTHVLGTKYEPQDKIKIYIWNTGKDKLFIDDFCIRIYTMKKS